MAQQEYDWFEENAPPEQFYQEPDQQQQDQQQSDQGGGDSGYQSVSSGAQQPDYIDNGSGNPDTHTDDPNASFPYNPSGGDGGNSAGGNDGGGNNGGGGNDRAARQAQADALNRSLGLSDPGNLESFLSGRNSYAGYLADEQSRATNYTGNRLLDSQGGNYNNNGTLTPQGIAALARAGLNPNGTRMAPTGSPGGSTGGGSFGGDTRDYGMLAADGTSAFSAAPAAFGESYSTLERPESLKQPYTPRVWGETFKNPTLEDVQAEPGYALGLKEGQNALERSAAARGSVLSGGTQKATARYGVDYGATKYAESSGRMFDQYKQRYGQFLDEENINLGARNTNENAYGTDASNNLSQYLTRFNAYQTAIGNTRNAENDVWSRNQDLIRNSLTAAGLARP